MLVAYIHFEVVYNFPSWVSMLAELVGTTQLADMTTEPVGMTNEPGVCMWVVVATKTVDMTRVVAPMKMTMDKWWANMTPVMKPVECLVDKWWANMIPVMKPVEYLVDKWWANMIPVMKPARCLVDKCSVDKCLVDKCWLAVMKTVGLWLDKCWVMTELAS